MTIYISPNPGKTSANEIALRAAQILMNSHAQAAARPEWFICRWRNALSRQM